MNIYKLNYIRLNHNSLLHRTLRVLVIYSLLYLSTSEIFAGDFQSTKNCRNDYLISTTQNNYEINLNERSQRTKITVHNQFNFDKSLMTLDQFYSLYTEYFIHKDSYAVHLFYLSLNSNHSLRAPPLK
jgi:hypothetical protein